MSVSDNFKNITNSFITFLKWSVLGLLMSVVGGLVGALFAHSL